jgi:predicted enzyme related to lactoylglutathione lyase
MSEKTGNFIWYELMTSDADAAAEFYGAAAGWAANPSATAGMPPMWLGYVNVADVDESPSRIEAAGGSARGHGPRQVPTGDWIIQARDPRGAMFALVGPAKS